ncbi:MAG: aminopeptidase [Candidatus Aenigmarchaeota archaeon]|nr:aminopeptidase [Candidatus Aenigmarchaeota archaeon]
MKERKRKTVEQMLGAKIAVNQCMKISEKDRVLIITDEKADQKIVKAIKNECLKTKAKTTVHLIEPLQTNGQEPDVNTAKLMKEYQAEFLITSKSLSHTKARIKACKSGARIASMPGITKFSLIHGGLTADYNVIKKLCLKMFFAIKNSKNIKIISKNGTDFEMQFGMYDWDIDEGLYHKPGDFGNLPAGEVDTSPNDFSSKGRIIIDKMGSYGDKIEFKVREGVAYDIKGSQKMIEKINEIGEKVRIVAELGIGTNPKAKVIGNVLEDEKVLGTVHIAFGNNTSYGGKNKVQFHQDGIILKPTLIADNKKLIKNGVWLI